MAEFVLEAHIQQHKDNFKKACDPACDPHGSWLFEHRVQYDIAESSGIQHELDFGSLFLYVMGDHNNEEEVIEMRYTIYFAKAFCVELLNARMAGRRWAGTDQRSPFVEWIKEPKETYVTRAIDVVLTGNYWSPTGSECTQTICEGS
jgi:hypothetical protein